MDFPSIVKIVGITSGCIVWFCGMVLIIGNYTGHFDKKLQEATNCPMSFVYFAMISVACMMPIFVYYAEILAWILSFKQN